MNMREAPEFMKPMEIEWEFAKYAGIHPPTGPNVNWTPGPRRESGPKPDKSFPRIDYLKARPPFRAQNLESEVRGALADQL